MSFLRRMAVRLDSKAMISYLGYALGEIVLVVIGILLALQINGWNEARKDRELEETYYCKLLEDLNLDVALMEALTRDNQQRIERTNDMLVAIQAPRTDVRKLMAAMRGATARTTYTFRVNEAAFEDLKSGGHLSLLDAGIKDQLVQYYNTMEGFADVVDVNSDASVNLYYHADRNFVDLGWQYLPMLRKELDSTRVDLARLDDPGFPSKEVRKQLTSDAVFYLGTNSRKKELYDLMMAEITRMQTMLRARCKR